MNELVNITKDIFKMEGDNKYAIHTLNLKDKENQIKLYNSLQQCDVLLNDIRGQEIEINDVYIEKKFVHEKNEKGEIIYDENGVAKGKDKYRTILFGSDGKTYVASAYGIYNSINQIMQIFGVPSSDNPIKVKIGERNIKNSNHKSLILLYQG